MLKDYLRMEDNSRGTLSMIDAATSQVFVFEQMKYYRGMVLALHPFRQHSISRMLPLPPSRILCGTFASPSSAPSNSPRSNRGDRSGIDQACQDK